MSNCELPLVRTTQASPPLTSSVPQKRSYLLHREARVFLSFSFLLMFKRILPLPAYLRRSLFEQLTRASRQSILPLSTLPSRSSSPQLTVILERYICRSFSSTPAKMSDLSVELTAPNGRKYTQPTGLFINNEWVKSSDGKKIVSINPTYAILPFLPSKANTDHLVVTRPKLLPYTQPLPTMSTQLSQLPVRHSRTPHGAISPPPTEET